MEIIKSQQSIEVVKYRAVDGTVFSNKEECIKYEDSAKCLLFSKYKPLVVHKDIVEEEIFGTGSEEYGYDIIKLRKKEDIDVIMQLHYLINGSDSYRRYNDSIKELCTKALEEDDFLFIGRGYQQDTFWVQFTKNLIFKRINTVCNEGVQCD